MRPSSRAFTLIELLIVIAIIAVLATVVVLALNPAELLRQSRDANRNSDMANIVSAIGLYQGQGGASLGSANTVYVSIPDPSATSTVGDHCEGLSLIALPANYSYHCAASSTYRLVNGTGWIPINFMTIAAAPFGELPVDPTNTSSSRLYYTYTTNGNQYEVTSVMESVKYKLGGSSDVVTNDGGTLASVYEKGTKLGLEPLDYGDPTMAGYWTFDEGAGSVAYDYSGNNATGSWAGTPAGTGDSYYSAGRIGPYAGYFASSGSPNTVTTAFKYSLTSSSNFSWSAWIYIVSAGSNLTLIGNRAGSSWVKVTPSAFEYGSGAIMSYALPTGAWDFVAVTKAGTSFTYYLNGAVVASATNSSAVTNMPFYVGGDPGFPSDGYLTGSVDDVRLYNRTLSAAEITALYAGGK